MTVLDWVYVAEVMYLIGCAVFVCCMVRSNRRSKRLLARIEQWTSA